MEWIIPLALSLLIMQESRRHNDGATNYSVDYSKLAERDRKSASIQGIHQPENMVRQNCSFGKRSCQSENENERNMSTSHRAPSE